MPNLVFSRWYMSKTLSATEGVDSFAVRRMVNNSWVKNVNNLRKISSKSGVYISTKQYISEQINNLIRVQSWFIQYNIPLYSTTLYTHMNNKINLLNKSFTYYPQSLLMRLVNEN